MPSSSERVKVVKRTLADGSVKEYRYAAKAFKKVDRNSPGSVGALIQAYRRSQVFLALSPATVKNYGYYLRDIEDFADLPVASVRRKLLLDMRDAIATERGIGAANVFMRVCTTLLAWAVDREWIEHSPATHVKALRGGHLAAWTAEEADKAASTLPEPLRRVVVLARYTGQRRGDLIAMTWHAYDGTTIRLTQQKTRAPLVIPVHPALKVELDAWRKTATSTHILTSQVGRPWKANHLSVEMARLLPTIGLRDELNVHGLRKLAAASLAQAGCSVHEIAAVTGHRSLAMVQLYTASAEQERLAGAAILRLENVPGKR